MPSRASQAGPHRPSGAFSTFSEPVGHPPRRARSLMWFRVSRNCLALSVSSSFGREKAIVQHDLPHLCPIRGAGCGKRGDLAEVLRSEDTGGGKTDKQVWLSLHW